MRIAIVHDFFMNLRGSERQLMLIAETFPDADIFFLVANDKLVKEKFFYRTLRIKTSFLNKMPFKQNLYSYFYPVLHLAVESLDLRNYDLVISSSSHGAKGVITREDALHFCYMYTPTRHIWDMTSEYFPEKSLLKFFASPQLFYLRNWDVQAAQRPDKVIAISNFVAQRIKKYYGRESFIIYPGIDFPEVHLVEKKDDYYVHITSFEPNKNTDLVLKTFKKNKEKIKIIGSKTRNSKKLLKNLPKNIEFVIWPSEEQKNNLIAKAQAVIIAGVEDFGMVSVESQYLGTPVIAFAEGGSLETVQKDFLFEQKTVESLQSKIEEVKTKKISAAKLRQNIADFGGERFKKEFKKYVMDSYANRN